MPRKKKQKKKKKKHVPPSEAASTQQNAHEKHMRPLTVADVYPTPKPSSTPVPLRLPQRQPEPPTLAEVVFAETEDKTPAYLKRPTHVHQLPVVGAETDIGRETEKKNTLLCTKAAQGNLTMDDLAKHTTFLRGQREALQCRIIQLTKRARLYQSLIKKKKTGEDMGRAWRWHEDLKTSEKKLRALRADTVRFNLIVTQVTSSPAYMQMMQHVRNSYMKTPSGKLVQKIVPDENDLSFEELLAQMKVSPD